MRIIAPTEPFYDPAWSEGGAAEGSLAGTWPREDSPWVHVNDPSVPHEWGGNGELVADSVGADSYTGGNVTYPPAPTRRAKQ